MTMSASDRTHGDLSPVATSVAPPLSPRRAVTAGKYVLAACQDGTGRAHRGVATVSVAGATTSVRFRRIPMTGARRSVHTGTYELDPGGNILREGTSIGRWQSTERPEAQLIFAFVGATEIWSLAQRQ